MKKFTILFIMLISICVVSLAKDINAWKSEANLEQQFDVFKKNLNYWNGSFFMEPLQLNQFYGAIADSITVLEKLVIENQIRITSLKNELSSNKSETEELKILLDETIKRVNSFNFFGLHIDKRVYSFSMYFIILGVLVLAGFVFLMYKRSQTITLSTKKEYQELKEEFEQQKKTSLERYVQMNTELHNARMKLKEK